MKKLKMNEVFDKYMFAQSDGGRYLAPEGWHPLLGLPGSLDLHRGAVLFCKLQSSVEAEVQKSCLNGVIANIRIHRSAKVNGPDTMLMLASDLLREFEICQIPMMSDAEAKDLTDSIIDRLDNHGPDM